MHHISLKRKYVAISSNETFDIHEPLSDLSFSNIHTLILSLVCTMRQKEFIWMSKGLYCLDFSKPTVRKEAKIRNRSNQVPHLAQDNTWESDKNTIDITYNEPRGQLFTSR